MSKDTTETEKISAVQRAVNKVRAIQKGIVATDIALGAMAQKLGDAIEALPADKSAALEAALSKRNRGAEFEEGDSVVVKAEFSKLYSPKGPYTVMSVMTVGGDETTKRGGRSYLKAKHANGNTLAAPASCFEAA